MSTSLFFFPSDQNSVRTQNEFPINTGHVINNSGQIRTEPPQKSRGRKPGTKTGQQNQKKQRLRGMGVAQLERLRTEEEKKKMVAAAVFAGDTSATSPSGSTLLSGAEPVVVLQGFPSYGGGPTTSVGGCRSKIYCGGAIGSGQIMMDPVCCSPWGFVETSSHELSSIPNHQMYNACNNRCDTCFKKKRLDGDKINVVGSNGGGFSKYSLIPPPMINGYDHLLQQDHRSQGGFFYDQRFLRSASSASVSSNLYFNEKTNHTGSMDEFGSYIEENPRNGSGCVKEYEFFPGKYDNFQGKYGEKVSVVATTQVGDYGSNTSTIDLSLKL